MAAEDEADGHIYTQEVARAQETELPYTTPKLAPNNPLPPPISLIKLHNLPKTVLPPGDQMLEQLSWWGPFKFQ